MEALRVLFILPFVLLILAGFAFWIWMIVDCATHEPATGNDKLVWIVIIIFTHIIGALIYYIVRRRPRRFAEWQRHAIAQQRPS
ncbi:MAG: PLDc N-terminal domain-containing protein [Bryobacteraceae bacterium]